MPLFLEILSTISIQSKYKTQLGVLPLTITIFRVLKKKTMDVCIGESLKKLFRSSLTRNQNLHSLNIESFLLI